MKVLQFAIRKSTNGREYNTAMLIDGLIERAFNEKDEEAGDGLAESITFESVASLIQENVGSDAQVITITVEALNEADLRAARKKDEK